MKEMELTVLDYTESGASIRMERGYGSAPQTLQSVNTISAAGCSAEENGTSGGIIVKSPMVGVFYSSPGSEKKPYIEIGDEVRTGDILCIIEAMKIMNEITSECDGTVTGIFVENKQVVEFNQPLFCISCRELNPGGQTSVQE
jgi:acetyl-CoA carboxylase biotin carboxyl carrier protein